MSKKFAFVFPGQGSQSVGMLDSLALRFSIVKETFAIASDVLNYDLWDLVQKGPEERLNQTEYTQPALLTSSIAIWRVWQSKHGHNPLFLAGHSLGEYTALVCAESISFEAAVALVAKRGQFMQMAVPQGQGGMAAIIGLENQKVAELCEQMAGNDVLAPANFNAIGQVVVAGHLTAVERLVHEAKSLGAKLAKVIPVSVPSHCLLMKPAAEQLANQLDSIHFNSPVIPVIHNVDVCSYSRSEDIRSALVRQLYNPVRWVETVQTLIKEGVEVMVECGPGKVLMGLNKRIDDRIPTLSMNDPESIDRVLEIGV